MKKWKIEIILSVDDSWIADGFDASERVEDIQELFCNLLPYAYNHEIIAKAKITLAPDPKVIRSLQGYDIS